MEKDGTKLANSKSSSEPRVQWAELRFPPLNLWLMAPLDYNNHQSQSIVKLADNRRESVSSLSKLHQQLGSLLAAREGRG